MTPKPKNSDAASTEPSDNEIVSIAVDLDLTTLPVALLQPIMHIRLGEALVTLQALRPQCRDNAANGIFGKAACRQLADQFLLRMLPPGK